ncbi:MAG: hypothetical protein ACKOXB_02230 [Flavobacteriales bacterium]
MKLEARQILPLGKSYKLEFDFELDPTYAEGNMGGGLAAKDAGTDGTNGTDETLNGNWMNQNGHYGFVFRATSIKTALVFFNGNVTETEGTFKMNDLVVREELQRSVI